MLAKLTIDRFRGFQRLDVSGLRRVNLIIGRNDCGKTGFMEALEILDSVRNVLPILYGQQQRREEGNSALDFDRFWLPLFWAQRGQAGFELAAEMVDGSKALVSVIQPDVSPTFVAEQPERAKRDELVVARHYSSRKSRHRKPWALEARTVFRGEEATYRISPTTAGLSLPTEDSSEGSPWIGTSSTLGETDVGFFSKLKQAGRDAEVLEILRLVDDTVTGLELLAPSGDTAELFVRAQKDAPLLPMTMMGDGFQRCLQLAVAAAGDDWPTLFIDEFDNGLHHHVLESVWRWLAQVSATRGLQVFATTHSEECIQAACRAFSSLDDDDFRVIRLDRHADRTTAAIYDRSLVQAADDAGVELRG